MSRKKQPIHTPSQTPLSSFLSACFSLCHSSQDLAVHINLLAGPVGPTGSLTMSIILTPCGQSLAIYKAHSHTSSHLIPQSPFPLMTLPPSHSTPSNTACHLFLKQAQPFDHLGPLHLLFPLPGIPSLTSFIS